MESIKEKIPMIIAVIVAIAVLGVVIYLSEYKRFEYYTQVDNTKIEKISSSDEMKYEYKLTCYSPSGRKKEIKFKTVRELRNGAYLKLVANAFTGVNSWEEVQYDELPDKVKVNYTK